METLLIGSGGATLFVLALVLCLRACQRLRKGVSRGESDVGISIFFGLAAVPLAILTFNNLPAGVEEIDMTDQQKAVKALGKIRHEEQFLDTSMKEMERLKYQLELARKYIEADLGTQFGPVIPTGESK